MINPARFVHYKIDDGDHDRQHWELLQRMDELVAAVKNGEDTAPILTQMLKELEHHFNEEDAHMRSINFPFVNAHREDHDRLVVKLRKLVVEAESGNPMRSSIAIKHLEEMFIDHIDQFDMQCLDFTKKGC